MSPTEIPLPPPPPDRELIKVRDFLQKSVLGQKIRTLERIGRHFLLTNEAVMSNSGIYFCQIRKIGLGVVEINIAPNIRENVLIKKA